MTAKRDQPANNFPIFCYSAACILLAYVLGYAVFKSEGVWTAAYLHALSNQSLSFFMLMMFTLTNTPFSFRIGPSSLALGTIVVLPIPRNPIWKITE